MNITLLCGATLLVVLLIVWFAKSETVWGSDQFWTECEQPGRTCKP